MFANTTYKLNHPIADKISIIDHEHAYAIKGVSSEIAFFKGGNWVLHIIEPFEKYADSIAGDTRVYGHVPNEMIDAFLETYRV